MYFCQPNFKYSGFEILKEIFSILIRVPTDGKHIIMSPCLFFSLFSSKLVRVFRKKETWSYRSFLGTKFSNETRRSFGILTFFRTNRMSISIFLLGDTTRCYHASDFLRLVSILWYINDATYLDKLQSLIYIRKVWDVDEVPVFIFSVFANHNSPTSPRLRSFELV